ncbi:MAG: GAF domain-containing protein [Chloroflexota bacterium]
MDDPHATSADPDAPRGGLDHALARLSALRELDHAILTATAVEDVASVAVRRTRALLGVARAAVVGYDLGLATGTILAVDEDRPIPQAATGAVFRLPDIIPGELLERPTQHVYSDIDRQLSALAAARAMVEHGIHAVAWTPVQVDGRLLGMLVTGAQDASRFDDEALETAADIGRQLAVGMRVVQDRAARERGLHRLSVLHAIDRAILDATSIEDLAATVLPEVLAGMHASYARLFAYDLVERTVRLLADVRVDGGTTLQPGTTMPIDRVVRPEVLEQPRVQRFRRLEEARPVHPGDPSLPRELGAHAWVPLLAGTRLVGAFALGYASVPEPPDEDVAIATEVADQLAVAMVSAEARRTADRSLARLELVNEIGAAILGAQTPAEVAARAVGPLLGLASAQRVTVIGYDFETDTGTVLASAQTGTGDELAAGRVFSLNQIVPTEALREPRPLIFRDLEAIVDALPAVRDAVEQGFKASVFVPLVAGGELLGHLSVASRDTAVASRRTSRWPRRWRATWPSPSAMPPTAPRSPIGRPACASCSTPRPTESSSSTTPGRSSTPTMPPAGSSARSRARSRPRLSERSCPSPPALRIRAMWPTGSSARRRAPRAPSTRLTRTRGAATARRSPCTSSTRRWTRPAARSRSSRSWTSPTALRSSRGSARRSGWRCSASSRACSRTMSGTRSRRGVVGRGPARRRPRPRRSAPGGHRGDPPGCRRHPSG